MSHDDDELITKKETCRILGGNEKPLDPSTLYRGIKLERFPPPKHPSPGLSRWSKREVLATRRRIIEGDSYFCRHGRGGGSKPRHKHEPEQELNKCLTTVTATADGS